jgi:hypothetical protein
MEESHQQSDDLSLTFRDTTFNRAKTELEESQQTDYFYDSSQLWSIENKANTDLKVLFQETFFSKNRLKGVVPCIEAESNNHTVGLIKPVKTDINISHLEASFLKKFNELPYKDQHRDFKSLIEYSEEDKSKFLSNFFGKDFDKKTIDAILSSFYNLDINRVSQGILKDILLIGLSKEDLLINCQIFQDCFSKYNHSTFVINSLILVPNFICFITEHTATNFSILQTLEISNEIKVAIKGWELRIEQIELEDYKVENATVPRSPLTWYNYFYNAITYERVIAGAGSIVFAYIKYKPFLDMIGSNFKNICFGGSDKTAPSITYNINNMATSPKIESPAESQSQILHLDSYSLLWF